VPARPRCAARPGTPSPADACPANPRHVAKAPDHPRAVIAREDKLLTAIRQFCDERVFGPDRASLLAASYPATRAADTARKNRETARLNKRLKMIDAFEDAHTAELEALITADSAAHTTAQAASRPAPASDLIARPITRLIRTTDDVS